MLLFFQGYAKTLLLEGGFSWKGQLQSFGIFQLLHLTSHTVIWALEGPLRMATPLLYVPYSLLILFLYNKI
ncbi:hypothetical protein JHK82_036292 [Glycine max]|nr:hypothetical protein JHK82_036292 [Glycine max]